MRIRTLLGLLFLVLGLACPAFALETVTVHNPAGIRQSGRYVDEMLQDSMGQIGLAKPRMANQFPRSSTEQVEIRHNAFDEINQLFYHRGWTDGLPIVPPTTERVQHMLTGADLSSDFEIAVLDPMDGVATVEKIAVNAVMAGCLPAHMPVLIAAVEAVSRSEFNLRGMSTTTNPDTTMLILSGPFVKDLGINSGTNTFGRGTLSNTTLSRAFHLILQNVGGSWPGVTDMSTLGQPGEICMLLAENSEANPWEPWHTLIGQPQDANVVTVAAAEGYQGIMAIGYGLEGYFDLVASYLKGHDRFARSNMLLFVAQDTAQFLAKNGWTRKSIEEAIRSRAKIPYSEFKRIYLDTKRTSGHPDLPKSGDIPPDFLVSKPILDNLYIIVAGGTGEKSMIIPCWHSGQPQSETVRLPSNWADLVKEVRELN